ncbi:MAG: 30S ribosomal protein S20 [Candidatus Nomurabacteria bacterium GW2011_GWA2_40_9]|uniref:Small ribosomal subunit protein bS20 n=1 Tax=Candidatus Nomurabacteria bacterium GW2011_GWA2_40_9 TaxID=1618734 RepID=A0A0G0W4Z6_9BACT|nr:MAG: 30S ribosomal protein S20 [Candidatus Nomurabacteria bacterium GW2011_GWA2_40_9]
MFTTHIFLLENCFSRLDSLRRGSQKLTPATSFSSPDKGIEFGGGTQIQRGVVFSGHFCYIQIMPITKSAHKAVRGSLRKKAFNDGKKRAMKEVIKKVQKVAKENKTDKTEVEKLLSSAYSIIDKAAKKGVIKKNNASRKKSRLARLVSARG